MSTSPPTAVANGLSAPTASSSSSGGAGSGAGATVGTADNNKSASLSTSPSSTHQNSGSSGNSVNRLSPNISVNVVHHLHPQVVQQARAAAAVKDSDVSPLLQQQQQQQRRRSVQLQRMSTVHATGGARSQRSAVLYTSGRSVSISTAQLEPTYPWDYDMDNDDDDDLDDCGEEDEDADIEDDLAGEPYIIAEEEEYQHPSLENRKKCLPLFKC